MKIHYVLKGIHENPYTRTTKKRSQQQKARFGSSRSHARILYKSLENVNGVQARRGVRGPPGSTIIILKEIIRFKVTLCKYRVDIIQMHGDHNQSISWT